MTTDEKVLAEARRLVEIADLAANPNTVDRVDWDEYGDLYSEQVSYARALLSEHAARVEAEKRVEQLERHHAPDDNMIDLTAAEHALLQAALRKAVRIVASSLPKEPTP